MEKVGYSLLLVILVLIKNSVMEVHIVGDHLKLLLQGVTRCVCEVQSRQVKGIQDCRGRS